LKEIEEEYERFHKHNASYEEQQEQQLLKDIDVIFHKIRDYKATPPAQNTTNQGLPQFHNETARNGSIVVQVLNQTQNQSLHVVAKQEKQEIERIFKKIEDFKSKQSFDVSSASAMKAISAAEQAMKNSSLNVTLVAFEKKPELKASSPIIPIDKVQNTTTLHQQPVQIQNP
jgi:predicted S18 family serine protease